MALQKSLTMTETAERLGVTPGRIRQLVLGDSPRIPSRLATLEEIAELLASGRIKAVTPTGIRLIAESDVDEFEPKSAGRPKGEGE